MRKRKWLIIKWASTLGFREKASVLIIRCRPSHTYKWLFSRVFKATFITSRAPGKASYVKIFSHWFKGLKYLGISNKKKTRCKSSLSLPRLPNEREKRKFIWFVFRFKPEKKRVKILTLCNDLLFYIFFTSVSRTLPLFETEIHISKIRFRGYVLAQQK